MKEIFTQFSCLFLIRSLSFKGRSSQPYHFQILLLMTCSLSFLRLEDFGDFPKSVIAGILQHLKPKYVSFI